jgi:putative colanic acid biosynthesis glycosyltransferase
MLTVATVVFNDPVGLKRTIDSVRYQKERGVNIEFIVADGGSKKPTRNVIDAESDVIDVYLEGPDAGIYDGMNRAREAASGDSIIFINSGDVLFEHLDLAGIVGLNQFEKKNYYGKVIQRYRNDCYLRPKSAPAGVRVKDISHQAFFVPKRIYKSVAYDVDYPVSADRLWIKECLGKGEVVYIDEIISVFDLGGLSNSSNFKSLVSKRREKSSMFKRFLQYSKFILKIFCSQGVYYRLIYSFKFKHIRCDQLGRGVKL